MIDDKERVLRLLVDRPQDACELSSSLNISRNPMFSLLATMEKEGLIVWDGQVWMVNPASDSRPNGSPDSSQPTEWDPNV